jgi:hypothetical protein
MHPKNLPQLPADKANHFAYGCLIALAGAGVASLAGCDPRSGAALAAIGAGILKEALDYWTWGGSVDALDAVATAAGAVPVVAGYCLAAGWN